MLITVFTLSCNSNHIPVIFDSDINNELDDQHAIAYLVNNQHVFDVKGITVNATPSGGEIDKHMDEGERVLKLLKHDDKIPLIKGANKNFTDIKENINSSSFDGHEAVNFIINEVKKSDDIVTLIAVGKLTNVALALYKEPSISNKIRLVWLGSNYPNKGEYNLESDIPAMNYILNQDLTLEMVMVRYGKATGSSAVRVTKAFIEDKMPGLGSQIQQPVIGRHGGEFNCFGDYSVNLFQHINYKDEMLTRALYDVVAVAIVKNPDWGEKNTIPAPIMENEKWKERPNSKNQVIIWENFNDQQIIYDFFNSFY